MDEASYDYLIKVMMIGSSNVGKTCLIQRFCVKDFAVNYLPTIAIDFKIKILDIEGVSLKMQIWDTAGQERFNTLTESFFKSAHGIFITYSVDDEASFSAVNRWIKQVQNLAPKNVQVILLANKTDLAERVITTEQGEECARKFGVPFFEVSALSGSNVVEAFTKMGSQIVGDLKLQKSVIEGIPDLHVETKSKCCS